MFYEILRTCFLIYIFIILFFRKLMILIILVFHFEITLHFLKINKKSNNTKALKINR